MATTDNNLQVVNSMTQEMMDSLKNSEGKIPDLANQLIMTEDEDGVISSKGLEYVGYYYSSDGNVSVDIDLDKYDYFAFVRINTNSSTDVNLGLFPNTSFNVYTSGKPDPSEFNYCYLFWGRTFSTSIYITYNQNNDGYLRVYPSNYQLTFASSTSKPTTLTTYSNGTVTIANIILYRRKK